MVEPPPELVTADASSPLTLASTSVPHAGMTSDVEAIDFEARARTEEAEPSREVAPATGSWTDPFMVDDPVSTGDTKAVTDPLGGGEMIAPPAPLPGGDAAMANMVMNLEALTGEDQGTARAAREAAAAGSAEGIPTPEAPAPETTDGSTTLPGATAGSAASDILAPTGDLPAGTTITGGDLAEHGGAAGGAASNGGNTVAPAAEGTARTFGAEALAETGAVLPHVEATEALLAECRSR